MKFEKFNSVEDLLTDESFLNYYFQKNENDSLDWEDWKTDVPKNELLIKEAFLLLDRLSLKLDEKQIKTKLQQLQLKINAPQEKNTLSAHQNKFFWLRIAAAIALLVGISIYFSNPKIVHTEGGDSATTLQIIENKTIGKIISYKLADGTLVHLNSGSKIQLAEGFSIKNRTLYLTGEAYFEVAKNPSKPFCVHAGKSITTAIGTAFTVRAIQGEASVKILLVEGKIKVQNVDKPQKYIKEISACQQVEIQKDTILQVEYIKNMPLALRWKDGLVMTFRDAPLNEVFKVLSENYAISIVSTEPQKWKDLKITAEFDKSMPLSAIMEALQFANDFNFLIRNDSVLVYKHPPQ